MDNPASKDPPAPADPWERHRRDQELFIAQNTTAHQRMMWLEEMLELLRPYLPSKAPPDTANTNAGPSDEPEKAV